MVSRKKESRQKHILYVGLDHNDRSVLHKGEELIDQWVGREGKGRLFVEGPPRTKETGHTDPISNAVFRAQELGVKVVFLETTRIGKLGARMKGGLRAFFGPPLFPVEKYLATNVRERRWIQVLARHAQPGDIVIVHQNHLRRILRRLPKRGRKTRYLSKPIPRDREANPPLSPSQVAKLKRERNAERPINRRKL